MKRKNDAPANGKSKKRAISDAEAHQNFRSGLFDPKVLQGYTDYYAASQPYEALTEARGALLTWSPVTSTQSSRNW